jgi:cytochrome c551/c552
MKITATVTAKYPDHYNISYLWHLGNGIKKETTEPLLKYTFSKAGDYAISVEVKDDKNASSTSSSVNIYAGNEAPTVNIKIDGNQTFYFPGKEVKYEVLINDKEDGSHVEVNNLIVSADYTGGTDKAAASQGHQILSEVMMGKNKMLTLDCMSCHKVDEKSVGPSFTSVSQRYKKDTKAMTYLAQKVMAGGSGVWGPVAMPAHPDLKENDAKQIISWVLSLDQKIQSLPAKGALNATLHKPVKDNGVLYISAAYTDKGGNKIKPLMGSNSVALQNSKITFEKVSEMQSFSKASLVGTTYLIWCCHHPPVGLVLTVWTSLV